MPVETEIPPELLEPPEGPVPPTPALTGLQLLPVEQLTPDNFERLCLRLARLAGTPERVRRYGTPGQKQYGIGIYSRLPSGRYVTYQCKRYQELEPGDLSDAADRFLDGKWALRSERFVFCTSASVDRTQVEEEIEKQSDRLAQCDPPIAFEVLDVEELSQQLRDHEDIVRLFFGPDCTRRFFADDPPEATTGEIVAAVQEAVAASSTPTIVSNDWAPPTLRPRLEELRTNNADAFRRLTDHLGNPPEPALVAAAVATPPPWLREADESTWTVLARIAEALGSWTSAAQAWERVAGMRTGRGVAGAMARAANAAHVGGDSAARTRLLEAAFAADPGNPRVVLSTMDPWMPPGEQLQLLEGLQSDDPEEVGLIAAQQTVAHLLLADTESARDTFATVREHLPQATVTDGLEVSIVVQEGRLAVLEHRTLDRGALERVQKLAEKTRERYRAQNRFSESTRMVMLRADIYALLGERSKAALTLRGAEPDEREAQEQKEVLAESAAGRALDSALALEILDGAADTPTTLRLRLEAAEESGTPSERDQALAGLEQIVSDGGEEAAEAAFQRLAATLGPKPTPWSDEAAVYLRSHGHERAAVTAEAMYRVQSDGWDAVDTLLRPYGTTPWALAARLRAASHPGVPRAAAVAAARSVLEIGADPALRVEAARALGRGREFASAREILSTVARDPNAPDSVRADAYDLLVRIVGRELDEWEAAGSLFDEWVALRPADTRAHSWAPTVANRRRSRK